MFHDPACNRGEFTARGHAWNADDFVEHWSHARFWMYLVAWYSRIAHGLYINVETDMVLTQAWRDIFKNGPLTASQRVVTTAIRQGLPVRIRERS